MSARESKSQIVDLFIDYVFSDLLKVVYDGFGGASKFRCYLVGRGLLNHITANFSGMEMTDAIKTVISFMKEAQIVGDAELSLSEPILELIFRNCRFSRVEKELAEAKVPLFACPCANVCLGLIEDKFGIETEIISIEHKENSCKVKAYLFK